MVDRKTVVVTARFTNKEARWLREYADATNQSMSSALREFTRQAHDRVTPPNTTGANPLMGIGVTYG